MKKLALVFVILASVVGVVSIGIWLSSDEEWDRNYADCVEVSRGRFTNESKSDKNACEVLINRSIEKGWGSLKQCSRIECEVVGDFYLYAERYKEAIPYYEKAIALGNTSAYTNLGNAYFEIKDYDNAKKTLK